MQRPPPTAIFTLDAHISYSVPQYRGHLDNDDYSTGELPYLYDMVIQAFSLYGKCEVVYEGRASSILEAGNYLILCKPDMCIAVHGATFTKPLNYQNPGSEIVVLKSGQEFEDIWTNLFSKKPKLIIKATNKKESLIAAVHKVIHHQGFDDWTTAKIKLIRSEKDLVNQIIARIDDYFPDIPTVLVETEVSTPYGNVDILILDREGVRHIVEVKRKIMSVAGCGQIARYGTYFTSRGVATKQYVAAPAISKNAIAYVTQNGQTWVQATFDTASPSDEVA